MSYKHVTREIATLRDCCSISYQVVSLWRKRNIDLLILYMYLIILILRLSRRGLTLSCILASEDPSEKIFDAYPQPYWSCYCNCWRDPGRCWFLSNGVGYP